MVWYKWCSLQMELCNLDEIYTVFPSSLMLSQHCWPSLLIASFSRKLRIHNFTVSLYIKDNEGDNLNPGEMLWFDSARLVQIEQWLKPLNGKFYDNLFVFFKPRGVLYTDISLPWVKCQGKEGLWQKIW